MTHCTVYGHEHYRLPCRGCRAEALAVDTDTPSPLRLTPEQAARNAQHAHTIRTQLDHAQRAAGERED